MSTQLARKYDIFEQETQENFPHIPLGECVVKQFEEKFLGNQALSYSEKTSSQSFSSEQVTGKESETSEKTFKTPIVRLEAVRFNPDRFLSFQKWEGIVIEVSNTSFVARLIDLTANGPDEEAEFSIEEISKEDRGLLQPGAIFYWNIGYHDTSKGQRIRSSLIRFRRLPVWQKAEIDEAKQNAVKLRDVIDWK